MRRFLLGLVVGAVVIGALVAGASPASARAESQAKTRVPAVRVTPEMVRYSRTRYALYFVRSAADLLLLLLLLYSGLNARLAGWASRRGRGGFGRAALYYPAFAAMFALLSLPLSFYAGYLLPHAYGLSSQSVAAWGSDRLKGLGINAALGTPVVALLYWTLRRSPRAWWLGFWLASIPLIVFATLLAPLVVDPLFNRFQPLRDPALRDRILGLAARAGIERGRVFEVDASRRTRALNAYVSGLGGSARIVLWDTMLERLEEDEILSVMAHEMGHYVEGHVPLLTCASILGSFLVLLLTDRGARWLLRRCGPAWRVRELGELGSFPVLLLVVYALNFAGAPVEAAVSRTFEERADRFALRITGSGRAAASAFVKLSEGNLSHPSPPPFIVFWMFSHPPLQARIDRALEWDSTRGSAAP